jgi:hypothetical protein
VEINARQIFSIQNESQFNQVALDIFQYQRRNCSVYKAYVNFLGERFYKPKTYQEIPFLPISFFKTHEVISSNRDAEITFSSSGTTGQISSKHIVTDLSFYQQSYRQGFRQFYGEVSDYCVLALLPSYLEREGSSLIYMVDDLIQQSGDKYSGYFLHNHDELHQSLIRQQKIGKKTILIGVTYALLDFLDRYTLNFPELIVMETGGMKGKRKEIIRPELHEILCAGFGVSKIHSEYGMTELLSQAYSYGDGLFTCPSWMKVLLRETNDPLSIQSSSEASGGINVIDLANINSCSFIATQDLGKIHSTQQFEVLGRFDHADIRGCNLLAQ